MSNEIKRAAELWLCAELARLVKGPAWYPSKGGNEMADAAPVEPPFGFVMVTEAAKKLPTAQVWLLSVKIAYMSHIGDTTSAAHSAVVRAIEKAIPCLPTGYDAKHEITVHGTELAASEEFSDGEEKTHGDVFTVAMGVGRG